MTRRRPRVQARPDGIVPSYEITAALAAAERRRAAESRAEAMVGWFARLLWQRAERSERARGSLRCGSNGRSACALHAGGGGRPQPGSISTDPTAGTVG